MKKFSFVTLGCRVNQYESQAVRESLLDRGFLETAFQENCDLYIINTCAVTGESARKGRQMIRRALRYKEENPSAVVCVCGCFSQGAGEEEAKLFSLVDLVAGNTKKGELARILSELCEKSVSMRKKVDLRENIAKVKSYEPLSVSGSKNARAFVKIEDGCNSFCSYCYVPLVRGRVRSRDPMAIFEEVARLTENGFREIVLTGIETGSYGEDLNGGQDLASLVEQIHDIPNLHRIRFGSLKPTVFSTSFCDRLSVLEKVMPHFHLSLQSGSSSVLSDMGRKYGRKEETQAISAIYKAFPDAGLSADLICGFPGETEENFCDTLSLVQEAKLLHTHIFPFSPRTGTRAANMQQTVSDQEKKERCARLLEVAKRASLDFAHQRKGAQYFVLCEKIANGFFFGYTENFIYTKTPVSGGEQVGKIYPVQLQNETEFLVETMTVTAKRLEKY